MATIVLGTAFGDEGKGKLVDILSRDVNLCARAQVGPISSLDISRMAKIALLAGFERLADLSVYGGWSQWYLYITISMSSGI